MASLGQEFMRNIKEEGSPDGGESQSETQDISVSCNYSFDILCAKFYLLFVLFTVLKTRSGLLACL